MTDPTQEQRARWLEKFRDVSFATPQSKDPEAIVVTDDDTIVAICATIAAEAVEAERSRLAEGARITDAELWASFPRDLKMFCSYENIIAYVRPLIAEATARGTAVERQRLGLDGEPRGEMTDEEIDRFWNDAIETSARPMVVARNFARALLASQADRETLAEWERCARWHDARSVEHKSSANRVSTYFGNEAARPYWIRAHVHDASAAAHRVGERE